MKLIVFGSTGGTGQQLVRQALEQGHAVRAFTRSPDKVGQQHRNLEVVQGDVLDLQSVKAASVGRDAVLCTLGMPLLNTEKLRARGTENIVKAMLDGATRRLVCLSSHGVGDSWKMLPFHYKYLIVPLFMRALFADHQLQENFVRNSPLDWVLVRPGNFSDGRLTGAYRHGFTVADTPPKPRISRADVADFMLKQLTDDTYLRQSPSLSY